MFAARFILQPKTPVFSSTQRFLTREAFRRKSLGFLKNFKEKLLAKEQREEQALLKASRKFYKLDNLDPKKWTLIHIERYGGWLAGLTGLLYAYAGCLTLASIYFYLEAQKPPIFQILVAFENLSLFPDKCLFFGSLFLAYIYNSTRKRFVLRIYRNLNSEKYFLVTPKWNMRPQKTAFSAKNEKSAIEPTKIYMFNYWRKYLFGNLRVNGRRYIVNFEGFSNRMDLHRMIKESLM